MRHRRPTRRSVLRATAASVLWTACDPGKPTPPTDSGTSESPLETDPISPITPNESFYITTYNRSASPTEEWVASWTLTIAEGGVDVATLTLAELQALPSEEVEHTLECIGNGSDRAISNANWTGIRLSALLAALRLAPGDELAWVSFDCGDGYSTCLPRSDLDGRVMLVWGMNGEDLPLDHGAPVRLLVPGRFGMKNPKWIERIDFVDAYQEGTWEAVGWSDDAPYLLHSWIHFPDYDAVVPRAGATLQGSAFAGAVAIAKVEVSTDGGITWEEAEITYAGPENCWTLWQWVWVPEGEGSYELMVRATDVNGNVQADDESYDADLDGFEGIHAVTVYVG